MPAPPLRLVALVLSPVLAVAATLGVLAAGPAAAAAPVDLGSAASFAVLGGSTVTNTGPTVLDGDLGVSPGTAISGFPPGIVNGATHTADVVADEAKADVRAAYLQAEALVPDATIGAELGGQAFGPGVYRGDALSLTGTLTLDAGGDPSAVFVLQAASSLTTASSSLVVLADGAQACNVFWQVGSSATLGTSSTLRGTVLALTSITATTGATVDGRLLARNGAVTLDTNAVTVSTCAAVVAPPVVEPEPVVSVTPSATPSATPTASVAPSATPAPSASPVETPVPSASPVETPAPSASPVQTPAPSAPPVQTPAPSAPPSTPPAVTPAPSVAPVVTPSPSSTPGMVTGNTAVPPAVPFTPTAPFVPQAPGTPEIPQLPRTGTDSRQVAAAGVLAVLLGGLMLLATCPPVRGAHEVPGARRWRRARPGGAGSATA